MLLCVCVVEYAGATTVWSKSIERKDRICRCHDSGHPASDDCAPVRAAERQSELGPVGCAEMADTTVGRRERVEVSPGCPGVRYRGLLSCFT